MDLPGGLSKPALRAIAAAGYTSLEQFAAVTTAELGKLHGFGPKGVEVLRRALAERGLAFADERTG